MPRPGFTADVPPAVVELLVLKTLELGGAMNAYGIALFIQATSEAVLSIESTTLYRALNRLTNEGLICAEGTRGARSYRITSLGREALPHAVTEFERASAAVHRVLEAGVRSGAPALVE